MYDRIYTRIDTVRKYVDEMLLKSENLEHRRSGYVHLYGVGMAAAMIALKRGHNKEYAELAEIAGMLHDYYFYDTAIRENHAHKCEPVVRKLLEIMKITTEEETNMICSAIYNHSNKNIIDSEFDEIIKDADVFQHWMRNPCEPIFKDETRIKKLAVEFGLNVDSE